MIKSIRGDALNRYDQELRKLEATISYPFGDDRFQLDHGSRYVAFFERLGEPVFNLAVEKNEVIAAAAGVLRQIPMGRRKRKAWYLCDLKVRADHRGRNLTSSLFRKNLFKHYFQCPRGYAISMNPPSGENKVVALLRKLPYFPISLRVRLDMWSFDFATMKEMEPVIREIKGPVSYLSLTGKKDLRMLSNGEMMPLLHVQHGPMAEPGEPEPRPGFTHMICAPEGSALHKCLLQKGFSPSASASIVAHRMNDVDWGFILTSEI